MEYTVPDDLRYAESHEWVEKTDDVVRIGITDLAQDELGDIVFVDLPSEGDTLERDEEFGVIESIKAVSDMYSPVSGTVVGVNEDVLDQPELVNESPFDRGWLIEIESTDELDHLLGSDEYRDLI